MMTRNTFVSELNTLKQEVKELGKKVENTFRAVVMAMDADNRAELEDLIDADEEVNKAELAINEQAVLVIARQQPVAGDLRHIIVCLKISSDLERMGDLSVDMAKAYLHMASPGMFHRKREELLSIADKVRLMIGRVMKAYDSLDVLQAQDIAGMDDDIDRAYGVLVKELLQSRESTADAAQLAFISRFMERIGDYCTNIAEWIIYEVNGSRFDLN
jgi:phosphate transport system protein